MNKEVHIDFSAPLCEKDKENQTYGCRHTNKGFLMIHIVKIRRYA